MNEIANIGKMFPQFATHGCTFKCKKHGEVNGYYFETSVEKEYVCPLCEEEARKAEKEAEIARQAEYLKKQRYDTYRERNIEPEYWEKELKDYIPQTPEQEKALAAVNDMIAKKSGKVILLGSNGVGKTFLGSMAVKALDGKILSMYEITTMIRQSYSVKAERTELEIVQDLASIPMLVIDEMGRTKGSDAELNWLSYILDKRHTRNLPFMILTNTHLSRDCPKKGCDSCFERFVNNDVLSRLRENSKIITIKAPDYRARK